MKKTGQKKVIRKSKKKRFFSTPLRILLIPIFLITIYFILNYNHQPQEWVDKQKYAQIPEEYIHIYKEAEKIYGVPWTLLAAHHRVETRFSTMNPMISPVGAEGPMQFMPCTFVGWAHPSCSGNGKGDIPEKDKVDPLVIKKYGGYGVDGNHDGKADPMNIEDAIFSAAKYLAANGASQGEFKKAVFAYNHSETYVNDVLYYQSIYQKEEDQEEKETALVEKGANE